MRLPNGFRSLRFLAMTDARMAIPWLPSGTVIGGMLAATLHAIFIIIP